LFLFPFHADAPLLVDMKRPSITDIADIVPAYYALMDKRFYQTHRNTQKMSVSMTFQNNIDQIL